MKALFNSKFLQHNPDSDGEGPYRIEEFQGQTEEVEVNGEEYITLVHPESYRKKIYEACNDNSILAEVWLSPGSYDAACVAVGLTVLASQQNDFAVVRPPGHHAGTNREAGFCLFNNIAIATQKLVSEGKKVFILDIDGHHGNGTQSIFYNSNKVFFFSVHQIYAFPFSGFMDETGEGEGEGFTMNVPLFAGSGDMEFLAAVDMAIKKAEKFCPDVVAVSAGFDGYSKDRILGLNYSLNAFYECGYRVGKSFKNVFAVLEGGYHYDIKKCIDLFMEGINKSL
ncbi:MAG: histone deacetylase [Bacteroidetes bacterium]|nr:histone deacetylase [Bacteroidota bacterium]